METEWNTAHIKYLFRWKNTAIIYGWAIYHARPYFLLSLSTPMMLKMLYSLLLLHRIMLAHSYVHLFFFFGGCLLVKFSFSHAMEWGWDVHIACTDTCKYFSLQNHFFFGSFLSEREFFILSIAWQSQEQS